MKVSSSFETLHSPSEKLIAIHCVTFGFIKISSSILCIPNPVYVEPDETNETFVEIYDNLTIATESYMFTVSQL